MHRSIGLFVVCFLNLAACNVENYEDCKKDDEFGLDDDFKTPKPPADPIAPGEPGSGATGTGGTDSAGASGGSTGTGEAGAPPVMEPPATPCEVEHDCAPGFNCNLETHECLPADAETCAELLTEDECTGRADCTPIYGGTNCSCGADCECKGGEPGCVCESFQFFVCQPAE